VIPVFGKNGKLVEINNSSFTVREGSAPNCKEIALLCKKYSVPVIVNSDSHFCKQIGCFDNAIALLKEINFPESLIVNANIESFKSYLKKYTNYYGCFT
jgi:putative hydrolase